MPARSRPQLKAPAAGASRGPPPPPVDSPAPARGPQAQARSVPPAAPPPGAAAEPLELRGVNQRRRDEGRPPLTAADLGPLRADAEGDERDAAGVGPPAAG
eukprot:810666-Alexandrium_andersonii.AAC.1